MENNTIKIEIDAFEKEKDGKKFYAYNAYDKDGKKMTAKFVRDVKNKPEETGTFIIEVSPDDINISNATRFETLWIRRLIGFEKKGRINNASSRFC